MGEDQQIFRQQSLERLSSPERLDQLLRIVRPQHWFFGLTLGAGLALAGVWSVMGTIPVTVEGVAILTRPRKVVGFQAPAHGEVTALLVKEGQAVQKDTPLVQLRLLDLEKEIELQERKRGIFHEHWKTLEVMEQGLADKEIKLIEVIRSFLDARKDKVGRTADRLQAQSEQYIGLQRQKLQEARVLSQELRSANEELHESYARLLERNDVTKEKVIDFQSRVIDSDLQMAELEVQAQALGLAEAQAQESFEDRMDRIEDIRSQLQDLDLKKTEIERRLEENRLARQNREQEMDLEILFLSERLEREGQIKSGFPGQILEVTATVGQQVTLGQQLGKLEIDDPSARLMALAYFRVEDGKKIEDAGRIHVYPAIFERERFGGIVGRIERVSDYAVTVEAVASQIGDYETARNLLGGQGRIEVQAHLETDPGTPSGYRWTSGHGPARPPITAGTTALVRVTVEERKPVSFLLPALRSMGD